MAKPNIAIVSGGYTGEYEISLKTGENIRKHLESLDKYNLYSIFVDKRGWIYTDEKGQHRSVDKNDFTIIYNGDSISMDAVFICIHGTPGEDGKLGGYLDMMDIPYCMSPVMSSALTFNKKMANRVLANEDFIHVAKSILLKKDDFMTADEILEKLKLPIFVKPNQGGSSLATNKAKTKEELKSAIDEAFDFDEEVLLEEFIAGREFSVGVFKKDGESIALPVTELISSNEFFDFQAKYNPDLTQEVTPADISPELSQEMREATVQIFDLFECDYLSRIDFIYHEAQKALYFLEVNTMPGQSDASILPQQIREYGMSLPEFYDALISRALEEGS